MTHRTTARLKDRFTFSPFFFLTDVLVAVILSGSEGIPVKCYSNVRDGDQIFSQKLTPWLI